MHFLGKSRNLYFSDSAPSFSVSILCFGWSMLLIPFIFVTASLEQRRYAGPFATSINPPPSLPQSNETPQSPEFPNLHDGPRKRLHIDVPTNTELKDSASVAAHESRGDTKILPSNELDNVEEELKHLSPELDNVEEELKHLSDPPVKELDSKPFSSRKLPVAIDAMDISDTPLYPRSGSRSSPALPVVRLTIPESYSRIMQRNQLSNSRSFEPPQKSSSNKDAPQTSADSHKEKTENEPSSDEDSPVDRKSLKRSCSELFNSGGNTGNNTSATNETSTASDTPRKLLHPFSRSSNNTASSQSKSPTPKSDSMDYIDMPPKARSTGSLSLPVFFASPPRHLQPLSKSSPKTSLNSSVSVPPNLCLRPLVTGSTVMKPLSSVAEEAANTPNTQTTD